MKNSIIFALYLCACVGHAAEHSGSERDQRESDQEAEARPVVPNVQDLTQSPRLERIESIIHSASAVEPLISASNEEIERTMREEIELAMRAITASRQLSDRIDLMIIQAELQLPRTHPMNQAVDELQQKNEQQRAIENFYRRFVREGRKEVRREKKTRKR